MGRMLQDRDRDTEAGGVSREPAPAPPKQEALASSLAWASAVGNQAVQRLARQTVARKAVEEEEELDEGAAPAAQETHEGDAPAAPDGVEGAAPAAGEAPAADVEPQASAVDGAPAAPAAGEAPAADVVPQAPAVDGAPAADGAQEAFAPEEAAGLAALDDLPEDELPE